MSLNKTIARIGYAMITEESDASTTYENPITYLESGAAGGREIKSSPKGEVIEIDADGILAVGGEINSGYDHDLTTLAIIDDLREKWLGRTIVSDGNIEFGGAVFETVTLDPKALLVSMGLALLIIPVDLIRKLFVRNK